MIYAGAGSHGEDAKRVGADLLAAIAIEDRLDDVRNRRSIGMSDIFMGTFLSFRWLGLTGEVPRLSPCGRTQNRACTPGQRRASQTLRRQETAPRRQPAAAMIGTNDRAAAPGGSDNTGDAKRLAKRRRSGPEGLRLLGHVPGVGVSWIKGGPGAQKRARQKTERPSILKDVAALLRHGIVTRMGRNGEGWFGRARRDRARSGVKPEAVR